MGRRPRRDPPPAAAQAGALDRGDHVQGRAAAPARAGRDRPLHGAHQRRRGRRGSRGRAGAARSGSSTPCPLDAAPAEALDQHVVFVPVGDAERLVDALAAAGAGRDRRVLAVRVDVDRRGHVHAVRRGDARRSARPGVAATRRRGAGRDGRAAPAPGAPSSPRCGPRTRTRSRRSTCWSSRRGRGAPGSAGSGGCAEPTTLREFAARRRRGAAVHRAGRPVRGRPRRARRARRRGRRIGRLAVRRGPARRASTPT